MDPEPGPRPPLNHSAIVVVAAPAATAARGAVPSAVKIAGIDGVGGATRPAGRGVLPPVAASILIVAAPRILSGAARWAVVFA